ncbi:gata zinc finger domain-containing [Fusarium longipes]|uniref:Gata zinc finger domain-containing n=1 Tax=Fusarium longipes TaxID=694270 RepID=A0A395SXK1_9HYPO|nr:gata zinc finger domain-containing [Fusarium longipes]
MKQPQSLTKTTNPALIRRRRERAHPCRVDLCESNVFPPRRCNFARRPPGSVRRIRHSAQDVQHTGLPLCDVVLFQNTAIPSPLAAKPASHQGSLSQLKAGSHASSLRSPATPARSIRSRSTRASMKDTYEARTWRNRLRRHSTSPRSLEASPCCTSCFTKETPMWREGPFGSHTLCNVCGLLYAKREARGRSVFVRRDDNRFTPVF